ncbi:hypothetical protein SBV1_980001 [Verrucomicrobia bacterium]|nr:hypothetical protein SBV1_980001 [Verrucomicrobiota bacterium]
MLTRRGGFPNGCVLAYAVARSHLSETNVARLRKPAVHEVLPRRTTGPEVLRAGLRAESSEPGLLSQKGRGPETETAEEGAESYRAQDQSVTGAHLVPRAKMVPGETKSPVRWPGLLDEIWWWSAAGDPVRPHENSLAGSR